MYESFKILFVSQAISKVKHIKLSFDISQLKTGNETHKTSMSDRDICWKTQFINFDDWWIFKDLVEHITKFF